MNARKSLLLFVLFFVLLALPIAGRYAHFYAGVPTRPEVEQPAMDEIEVPTPPAAQYSDETIHAGDGLVVVDMAHNNRVQMPELNVLAGRLAARGHQLTSWTGGRLEDALLEASALLVAIPLEPYDEDQVEAVEEFIANGGRLLLIGDPTRYSYLVDDWGWITGVDSDARYLNSLGASFGLTFVDDYLYNVSDNEGNFRNIKLSDWGDSDLTAGLETVVFYAAHSLAVADEAAVIRADDDTWSSSTDRAGGLVVAAQAAEGQVLALGDLTFMTEPYHTVWDNSRFIARIADFLTGAERSYGLADFPLFFGEKVAFIFTNNPELGPGQLQLVDGLQETFDSSGRRLALVDEPDSRTDTIFAGIYSQAGPITDTLAEFGVTLTYTPTQEVEEGEDEEPVSLDDTGDDMEGETEEEEEPEPEPEPEPKRLVNIENLGSYDMSGIAIILHQSDNERQVLIVLAASQNGLTNVLNRLPDGDLYDCVLADAITLCPTGVPFEEVEEDWKPIEATTPTEDEDEDEDRDGGDLPDEFEGELEYGDSVSGVLAEDEEHLWRFSGLEGEMVTIRVETESDMDLELALEDEDGYVLASADDNLSGDAEEISGHELPETGDYTIRVADFWDEGGDYTLTLELGEGGAEAAGGVIAIGETVEGTLEADQKAIWTFTGAADQAITIILQPDENSDVALELQDAEGDTLVSSDSGYSGDEERIEGRLPADGSYQIVVEEFYGDVVSYTLTLQEGGEGGVFGGRGVLIVSADDGAAMADGRTSAGIYFDLLASNYDVTLWTLSEDGPIEYEDMQGSQLIIWTSGDFEGGDTIALFSYLFEGGSLLLSGAYPGFYEEGETAALRDLEVSSHESVLTAGFTPGEIIELSGEMDVVVLDSGEDEEMIPIFLRGPASDEAGDVIAAGAEGDEYLDMHLLVIGFPLYLLPESDQTQLVSNVMEWFQVDPLP